MEFEDHNPRKKEKEKEKEKEKKEKKRKKSGSQTFPSIRDSEILMEIERPKDTIRTPIIAPPP